MISEDRKARRTESIELDKVCDRKALQSFLVELRMPLTGLRGFCDILLESGLDAAQREAVTAIQENAHHLIDLVTDFQDLVGLAAGDYACEPHRVELVPFLHRLFAKCVGRGSQRGFSVETGWGSFMPAVAAFDPDGVTRCVLALLSHAMRHDSRGAVRMTATYHLLRMVPSKLTFRIQTAVDPRVMPDEDLAVFRSRGLWGNAALGPVVAAQLAKQLGGRLDIEKDGMGRCTYRIDVAAPSEQGAEWIDPSRILQAGDGEPELRCRILLAEDTRDSRMLLAHALRRAGATLEVVDRGDLAIQAALRSLRSGRPFDVLLTDVSMPVLDGREVVRLLRAKGYERPIVCVSAHRDEQVMADCIASGADAYLPKPVSSSVLVGTIASLLEERT
ncbi:MAG: hypothetical protein Fur0037_04490 [Planctomycetota bacterium]